MKFRILVGAVASVALIASAAAAQVCQGDLSFRGRPTHIVGALGISSNTTSLGGGVLFGHAQGLYGGGSIGMIDQSPLNGNTLTLNGGIGYSMPLQQRSRWQLCPGGTLSLGFGPTVNNARMSSQTMTGGASIGTVKPLDRSLTLLPYASAAVGHTSVKVSAGGGSQSASDTYFLIGFGAGFQFSPSFVLKPSLGFALGTDPGADDTFFSLGATFALPNGRSRR